MRHLTTETRCLVPGCTRRRQSPRGCCQPCYAAAKRMVDRKETTWEELEQRKILLPKRTTVNFVQVALNAARSSPSKNGKRIKK